MTTDRTDAEQGQSPAVAAAARRAELAAFLRSQRARLRPADVGLPSGVGRRRTPGLRREEVAELSGMSHTWYTWLEQARPIPASAQVIDALARALRLDPDRHRHLRVLAGLPLPPVTAPTEAAAPRLRRLVDAAAPNAASLYDRYYDFLAWNDVYVRLRHDPGTMPPERRNLLWMMFTDLENRRRMTSWEPAARAVLSQFRAAAGRRPDDPRFGELVSALTGASPEFRRWWASYPVRDFKPATIAIDHPAAGRIALDLYQLRPVEHPDLLLVLQVPAGAEDARRVQALLAPPGRRGDG
ncbi:helix-turn-helix domain-containing protein [Frankia sp. CNm7]|uniref:Helix-turn-helix domain-containing protein n=1 Tax=Frankia nepalensis TaxID=1836974 RepID=A0A937RIV9_9ACTN|nr:helix-turn-helix transcriptional regulator [Frankia nepalensis]MBL7497103.1 helix-turn-helix domain-containing protein [Frankia nepalensis]MBL7510775.1 helix-turn-helix domain-containing protein [Frankia nepalensis]MBL7521551.1 helix-turn-helix domain-containing protein [Frankia nepalensis]MBL7626786.1 helix-turn-helix domain-containing protein [Frankia nepalensis]